MTVDDLTEYGVVQMSDKEIDAFLSTQNVGVLGLPTDDAPSLRPLSFKYDGENVLYLLYVGGSESRKRELSDQASAARFLVYSTETAFIWRSVLLTGRIGEVPEGDTEAVGFPRQPDLLQKARESEAIRLYRFDVTDRAGIKHIGLPPGLDPESTGSTDREA